MTLRKAFFGAAMAVALAAPAYALADTPIIENSGWQNDQIDFVDTPSEGSNWTFTVADNAVFSLIDCCIVGDVYKLYDSVTSTLLATSTFTPGAFSDVQNEGAYFGSWTDPDYSRIAYNVGPGSYSFSITGNGAGGLSAGFGVRLDSASGAPEASTWAMMLIGFAGMGATLRSARRKTVTA